LRNNYRPGGLRVEVHNGDFNKALRKFKKKVQDDGRLQIVREKQEYTKPTEQRKRAKAAARSRHLRDIRKKSLDNKKLYWQLIQKSIFCICKW